MRTRPICVAVVALAVFALMGCTPTVHRVEMDPGRVVGKLDVRLACAYSLQGVVDARAAGDRVGGLGSNMFVLDDPAGLVRRQLTAAGMHGPEAAGRPVEVRILQLYLAQNHGTKIPVVVYEVALTGQPVLRIRSQKPTMNWNSSEDEAYGAYSLGLADATSQMVERLNRECGRGT